MQSVNCSIQVRDGYSGSHVVKPVETIFHIFNQFVDVKRMLNVAEAPVSG